MNIYFDWDDPELLRGNHQHVTSAGFTRDEFEHVVLNPVRFEVSRVDPENRVAYGYTPDFEYIGVVYEEDRAEDLWYIRPVTAFVPDDD